MNVRVGVISCFAYFLVLSCATPPSNSERRPSAERSSEVLGKWEVDLTDLGADLIGIEVFAEGGLIFVAGSSVPIGWL